MGPWEKYSQPSEEVTSSAGKPWERYGSKKESGDFDILGTAKNIGVGALKGAANIGATLMSPIDKLADIAESKIRERYPIASDATEAKLPTNNEQRRAKLQDFVAENADPESLATKGGELAAEIAGTAGAGGVLAKGSKLLGVGPKIVTALESGGFKLGNSSPATTTAARIGDAAIRTGAGWATGAASAALVNPEDAATGGVIGAVLPGAVRAAGKAGAALAGKGLNPTLGATLKDAQAAGYVVPPSMAGAGVGSRVLEGISGKYKTNQLAGLRNQEVTDDLARRSVGLPKGAELTSDAMQKVRADAFKEGYEPLTSLQSPINTNAKFVADLNNIAHQYSGPAKSFPGVAKEDVQKLVDQFKNIKSFPASDALGAIQILRDNAGDAFRDGNKALGKANREIANILEDQIEHSLSAVRGGAQTMHAVLQPNGQTIYMTGADMLNKFRDARTLMAKAHTIEDAIREGGGHVDAKTIAREYQRAPKRLSGEIATIGKFANNFGDVAGIPKSGHANPFTVLDAFTGAAGVGLNPLIAALPAARVAARYGVLAKPYQKQFLSGAAPQGKRLSELLANPAARSLAYQASAD